MRVDAIETGHTGLDLDVLAENALEMPPRAEPALDLAGLDEVIRRPEVMPAAVVVRGLGISGRPEREAFKSSDQVAGPATASISHATSSI